MERLLEDAEKISGIEYDISSYADIVDAIHVLDNDLHIRYGTETKEIEELVCNGRKQHHHCADRKTSSRVSGVPIHLLCVYVLSVWIPAIPPSWRRVDADAIGIVGSPVFHRLRYLHLRDSTVTTYVHECLFTLGNVGIHHMRRDIPCLCHEPCHRGNSTALSATSLQHDIPDLCLQWFPVR